MQITLNVDDDTYNTLLNSGIDLKEQLNEVIATLTYKTTKEYRENKVYFQRILDEVTSGKAELVGHEDMWGAIDEKTR